jgi:hypothetical protein
MFAANVPNKAQGQIYVYCNFQVVYFHMFHFLFIVTMMSVTVSAMEHAVFRRIQRML